MTLNENPQWSSGRGFKQIVERETEIFKLKNEVETLNVKLRKYIRMSRSHRWLNAFALGLVTVTLALFGGKR